ncbi:hypothetical protein HDU93_005833, partial [Gonapodya sp. JEL0774]
SRISRGQFGFEHKVENSSNADVERALEMISCPSEKKFFHPSVRLPNKPILLLYLRGFSRDIASYVASWFRNRSRSFRLASLKCNEVSAGIRPRPSDVPLAIKEEKMVVIERITGTRLSTQTRPSDSDLRCAA